MVDVNRYVDIVTGTLPPKLPWVSSVASADFESNVNMSHIT